MHIPPLQLLLLILALFIYPSAQSWILDPGDFWFKPFILWFGAVIVIAILNRGGADEF